MKRFFGLVCLVIALATGSLAAQERNYETMKKNTVFAEALGNGGLYSLNYERLLDDDWSLRVGLSYLGFSGSDGLGTSVSVGVITVPITSSYLINLGGSSSYIELGGGVVPFIATATATGVSGFGGATGTTVAGTLIAGYRLQPAAGGFNFRAGFTPLYVIGGNFVVWGGLGLGFTF
jgi:hypothetical protein